MIRKILTLLFLVLIIGFCIAGYTQVTDEPDDAIVQHDANTTIFEVDS